MTMQDFLDSLQADKDAKAQEPIIAEAAKMRFTMDQVDKVTTALNEVKSAVEGQESDNSDVLEAIYALRDAVQAIEYPEAPEAPESITVSNLGDIKLDNKDVVNAIKAIKLAPLVVPAAQVNVPEIDWTTLTDAQKEMVAAIQAIKMPDVPKIDFTPVLTALKVGFEKLDKRIQKTPVTPPTPSDPLIRYTPADIDDVPVIQYFGFTDMSGHWYIRQVDRTANVKTVRFAFGQGNYAANFVNRASLTYGIWGT